MFVADGVPLHWVRAPCTITACTTLSTSACNHQSGGILANSALPVAPAGCKDGDFRATFEDKPLLSDIIFLRAWVAVPLPKFYNPITNLLDKHAAAVLKPTKADKAPLPAPAKAGDSDGEGRGPALEADAPPEPKFEPAGAFAGRRAGWAFKLGPKGLGYYEDQGCKAAAAAAAAAAASGSGAGGAAAAKGAGRPEDGEWVGMRTVAQLRRELGVGAPRNSDSLYRDIERAPKVFNPLKIPKALQAALPFATKPKLEAKRKRKTLEARRAVVMESGERKAATLLQQLNAIRNQKAKKRIEQQARRKEVYGEKKAAEDAWREKLSKEERKKRHRDASKAEKIKELGAKRGAKRSKKGGDDD